MQLGLRDVFVYDQVSSILDRLDKTIVITGKSQWNLNNNYVVTRN